MDLTIRTFPLRRRCPEQAIGDEIVCTAIDHSNDVRVADNRVPGGRDQSAGDPSSEGGHRSRSIDLEKNTKDQEL